MGKVRAIGKTRQAREGRPWGLRLIVRALCAGSTRGRLEIGARGWPCALGRTGRRVGKREGDGSTPAGCWVLREVRYRADRGLRPRTGLPAHPIRADEGWCDASGDRNYNRRIRHPYQASAEHLMRDDPLYDLVVILAYNERPRVQGRGSAIFMHLARAGYTPTAGCIALSERDLRLVLSLCGRRTSVVVPAPR